MKKLMMILAMVAIMGAVEAKAGDLSPQDQQSITVCAIIAETITGGQGCVGSIMHPDIAFTFEDAMKLAKNKETPEARELIKHWEKMGASILMSAIMAREGIK